LSYESHQVRNLIEELILATCSPEERASIQHKLPEQPAKPAPKPKPHTAPSSRTPKVDFFGAGREMKVRGEKKTNADRESFRFLKNLIDLYDFGQDSAGRPNQHTPQSAQ
jgi:hypothetical protein